MKTKKSNIYDLYLIVKDNQLSDMPTASFVKMLKNINRARVICQEIDAAREEASKQAITDEVREAGSKIEAHNTAIKLKMRGEDYESENVLPYDDLKKMAEKQNDAYDKLAAYEKSWRDEEVDIEIEKIPEEDFIKYVSGAIRKEGDKEVKITNSQAALLYEILVQ